MLTSKRYAAQLFDEKKTYYGPPRGWMLTFTKGLSEPVATGFKGHAKFPAFC